MKSMLPSLLDFSKTLNGGDKPSIEGSLMPYIFAPTYRLLVEKHCENPRKLANSISLSIYNRLSKNDYAALSEYDQRKCGFETWLSLYAERVAMDYIRQLVYPTSKLSVIFAAMGLNVAGKEADIDRQEGILEPTHKYVLRLLYDERIGFEEAAAILGVAPRVVRSIEFEALERIRMACRPVVTALAQ